jgi:hypothetical protein
METPPKKVSIVQVIGGLLFTAIWFCGTCVFGFAFIFANGMAGGSPNVNELAVKSMVLFVFIGACAISLAGIAGGLAIASAEQAETRKRWKAFGYMVASGLALQVLGYVIFFAIGYLARA